MHTINSAPYIILISIINVIVNLYNVEDGRIFDPNCRLYDIDRSCGRTFQLYKSLIKIAPVFYVPVLYNKVQNTTM